VPIFGQKDAPRVPAPRLAAAGGTGPRTHVAQAVRSSVSLSMSDPKALKDKATALYKRGQWVTRNLKHDPWT